MARGTQHRKRRPQANARVAAQTAGAAKAKPKVKHASWEDQLFFSRLRSHAKWVFVLLALAFALGFVLFGVGSGSTGISDILQNAFNGGGSGGKSASALRHQVEKHPGDAKAWRDLATKLQQDQKLSEAADALKRYTALRPHDSNALEELAGIYTRQGDEFRAEASAAQSAASLVAPGSLFQPASTTPLGRAFADPNSLQDPIGAAAQTSANQKASDAYSKLTKVEAEATAVYKKLIVLNPNDPTRLIQLANAAESSGDTKTAVAAYKKFLKLAPTDPLVSAVKQRLKQLTAGSTATVPSG